MSAPSPGAATAADVVNQEAPAAVSTVRAAAERRAPADGGIKVGMDVPPSQTIFIQIVLSPDSLSHPPLPHPEHRPTRRQTSPDRRNDVPGGPCRAFGAGARGGRAPAGG